VFAPYILDFGKAYLSDPKWEPHILEEWNERMVIEDCASNAPSYSLSLAV
jgi:hypothetical protein